VFCISASLFRLYIFSNFDSLGNPLIYLDNARFLSILVSLGLGIFLVFSKLRDLKELLLSKTLLFLFLSKMILGFARQIFASALTISSYGWMTMYFSGAVFIIWYRMEAKKEGGIM
jgi:hypothetical protein